MDQIVFRLRLRLRPTGRDYNAPPGSLAVFRGLLLKGEEGRRGKEKGRKKKEKSEPMSFMVTDKNLVPFHLRSDDYRPITRHFRIFDVKRDFYFQDVRFDVGLFYCLLISNLLTYSLKINSLLFWPTL